MVVELTGEGNTNEDEELAQVDKVKFKQHPMIKGKQYEDKPDNTNQQSHRESSLQIIVGFPADRKFQRCLSNHLMMMCPSLILIPTCMMTLMSMVMPTMWTNGLAIMT